MAARLAHIQEVTGSSPVCATRPMQDGRGSTPPIPEPVWRKSRRIGPAGSRPSGIRVRIPGQVNGRGRAAPGCLPENSCHACLAKLADAPALGAGVREDVRVQVPGWARSTASSGDPSRGMAAAPASKSGCGKTRGSSILPVSAQHQGRVSEWPAGRLLIGQDGETCRQGSNPWLSARSTRAPARFRDVAQFGSAPGWGPGGRSQTSRARRIFDSANPGV